MGENTYVYILHRWFWQSSQLSNLKIRDQFSIRSVSLAWSLVHLPEIPKSHIFTSPLRLMRIFDGFTSLWMTFNAAYK